MLCCKWKLPLKAFQLTLSPLRTSGSLHTHSPSCMFPQICLLHTYSTCGSEQNCSSLCGTVTSCVPFSYSDFTFETLLSVKGEDTESSCSRAGSGISHEAWSSLPSWLEDLCSLPLPSKTNMDGPSFLINLGDGHRVHQTEWFLGSTHGNLPMTKHLSSPWNTLASHFQNLLSHEYSVLTTMPSWHLIFVSTLHQPPHWELPPDSFYLSPPCASDLDYNISVTIFDLWNHDSIPPPRPQHSLLPSQSASTVALCQPAVQPTGRRIFKTVHLTCWPPWNALVSHCLGR